MGNLETIKAITANLKTVLMDLGIKFKEYTYEDPREVPIHLSPLGKLFYLGEDFAYDHGEKPLHIEASFALKVVCIEPDTGKMNALLQEQVHTIREGVTVAALNIGALAVNKHISKVITVKPTIDHYKDASVLVYGLNIRYREV